MLLGWSGRHPFGCLSTDRPWVCQGPDSVLRPYPHQVRSYLDSGSCSAYFDHLDDAALRPPYFSTFTTWPEIGSVTPSPPPRSSSVSRNESSVAIMLSRALTSASMSVHSAMMQKVCSPVLMIL